MLSWRTAIVPSSDQFQSFERLILPPDRLIMLPCNPGTRCKSNFSACYLMADSFAAFLHFRNSAPVSTPPVRMIFLPCFPHFANTIFLLARFPNSNRNGCISIPINYLQNILLYSARQDP